MIVTRVVAFITGETFKDVLSVCDKLLLYIYIYIYPLIIQRVLSLTQILDLSPTFCIRMASLAQKLRLI